MWNKDVLISEEDEKRELMRNVRVGSNPIFVAAMHLLACSKENNTMSNRVDTAIAAAKMLVERVAEITEQEGLDELDELDDLEWEDLQELEDLPKEPAPELKLVPKEPAKAKQPAKAAAKPKGEKK
tara:strand:+ start:202 stop:579 length:378 start_codon:yes stop_codon:yes gene_type:complete